MSRATFLAALAVLPVTFSLALSGCQGCSRSEPLAELTRKSGKVNRDFSEARRDWRVAKLGAAFSMGDAVRTGHGAGADLDLDDGSVLVVDEDTLIRFLDKEPGSQQTALELEIGSATLEAGAGGGLFRTSFGLARLEGGSTIHLTRANGGMRYEVLVGKAQLENSQGEKLDAEAGDVFEIAMGAAVLERLEGVAGEVEDESAQADDRLPPTGAVQVSVVGRAVKVRAPGEETDVALVSGDSRLEAGSMLTVGAESRVTVRHGEESAELAAGGVYVVGGQQLVTARSGTVSVAPGSTVRIAVPGGFIVTRTGSATIKTLGAEGTEVRSTSGAVSVRGQSSDGSQEHADLNVGETARLLVEGAVSVDGRSLSRWDIALAAGGGIIVHDPAPPTRVRFVYGDACEIGVVRLKGAKRSSQTYAVGDAQSATLPVGPGRAEYSLHCLNEEGHEGPAIKSGRVIILADAGQKPVPRTAPSTVVDVNGRNYTVMYQNQLPQVTFRWSQAPATADSFQLHLKGPGRSKTYRTTQPSRSFKAGQLSEGTHTAYFEGGHRVSRQSSVRIRFDNATPTMSLKTPANTGVGPGGALTVEGTVLSGWSVVVDGKAVGQDAEHRFSVNTTMPASGRPLVVQLTHPNRGAQFYLRRPAGGD